MNKNILNTGVQDFINKYFNNDIVSVLLKKNPFEHISSQELGQQLQGKKISQNKLPRWFNQQLIYYPKRVHLEQTSSEITAQYKAKLIHGKSLLDLTGGFGVDSTFFADHFESVIYCETNEELAEISAHNFRIMGFDHVQVYQGDGIDLLKKTEQSFDWIYADPSRRIKNRKVILLEEYEPNIPHYLETLFKKTPNVLLKTSPLLDITQGINTLKNVFEIHVIAVNNEVKELLWYLKSNFKGVPSCFAVNITPKSEHVFKFSSSDEKDCNLILGEPSKFLYEPNAAILKAGAFKSVAKQFNLRKLHASSHLYTGNVRIEFPGRCFKINRILPFQKQYFNDLKLSKANITTRNFPISVAQIRKKLNLKDGGHHYLFFTTLKNETKVIIDCLKC